MTPRLAEALAAPLLEDANLRAAGFAIDDPDDFRIGHEGGAGEHFATVLLEEQHLLERNFLADFGRRHAVHGDHGPGVHPDLAPASLNDCEHVSNPPPDPHGRVFLAVCKGLRVARKEAASKS